ncbi:hypothetical protein [Mesorhizobium sp. M0898]|uniref:hypothetical protein n=1 Tax=Mesorhizobium sp. M0898 TaxID=2957020 RepID=UPI003334A81E
MLSVNIVQGRTATGEITAGIPVSTGIVTPKLGFGHESTLTRNSKLDFIVNLNSRTSAICLVAGPASRDAGFSLWLSKVVGGINAAVGGAPTASISKYTYESDFIVKDTGGGGLDVAIVPVKVSASASATRSDIQNMKIEIAAVHFKKGKPVAGGQEFDIPLER